MLLSNKTCYRPHSITVIRPVYNLNPGLVPIPRVGFAPGKPLFHSSLSLLNKHILPHQDFLTQTTTKSIKSYGLSGPNGVEVEIIEEEKQGTFTFGVEKEEGLELSEEEKKKLKWDFMKKEYILLGAQLLLPAVAVLVARNIGPYAIIAFFATSVFHPLLLVFSDFCSK